MEKIAMQSVVKHKEVQNRRTIWLIGDIDSNLSRDVINELFKLDSINNDNIYLVINSSGGNVLDGLAIVDAINIIASEVCTIVVGIAASMAAIILLSGCRGKRYSFKNSKIMIHQPKLEVGMSSQIDIERKARMLKSTRSKLEGIICKCSNLTLPEVHRACSYDHFYSSDEALAVQFIDKIVG